MTDSIMIDPRYNGPPDSGQGGYVAGLLAARLGGTGVEVTLRRPPPLGKPLTVTPNNEGVHLLDDETMIAEARPQTIGTPVPEPPSFEEAAAAARNYRGLEQHPFPTCFVCGPDRPEGDGMHLSAGPLPGRNLTAAPWVPAQSLARDGAVAPEFVWAALDCPGGWATHDFAPGRNAVLGRITASLDKPVVPADRYVIASWPLGRDGRKMYAASAVFNEDRALHALALATWIVLEA